MSQQGIFSIAPGANGGTSAAGVSTNGGGNGSPFTAVSTVPKNEPDQSSPFTSVGQDSPFQQDQTAEQSRGGVIPQRRPEGQPPALGGNGAESEASSGSIFEAVKDNTQQSRQSDSVGGPFQINGFPEQNGRQVMEAAPVASVQEASPFVAVQDNRSNYETAKAGLEPQQDFAAAPSRYTPVQEPAPAQQAQPVYEPQQAVIPAMASAAMTDASIGGAPAFQQLELRAIFGVDHVLDSQEILQRARTLPGIRNVAVVGSQETEALSNFRQAMQGMGFGGPNDIKLNSGGGSVDFLTEPNATIAVLHEGGYAPGVQETLIIVAREIGKLA